MGENKKYIICCLDEETGEMQQVEEGRYIPPEECKKIEEKRKNIENEKLEL